MRRLQDYRQVSIERTTDTALPALSYSMMTSIATCPTKGITTYIKNRVVQRGGRAMALEAGRAAHETFAAARLWQLWKKQGLQDHARVHGIRLFGEGRFDNMIAAADEGSDERNCMLRFCLNAFYTSGFYDDPSDNRRTFVSIEEALIAYLDRYDMRYDVWVADTDNPHDLVGIEIPFDVTVSYSGDSGGLYDRQLRFIGTADGLHWNADHETLTLEDNKTASRLGDGWAMGWHTSHQLTGYIMALTSMLGVIFTRSRVRGLCIPLPRSYDAGGLATETIYTQPAQLRDFLSWMLHIAQVVDTYADDPLNAPKNTSACYNYFRLCSLLPMCASDTEDREAFYNELIERDQTPTERALDAEKE